MPPKGAGGPKPPMSMGDAFTQASAGAGMPGAPSNVDGMGPQMVTCPQCGATFDAKSAPAMGGGAPGGLPGAGGPPQPMPGGLT